MVFSFVDCQQTMFVVR